MAAVTYYDLGSHRKLRDLVFAGSHDAGITSGGGGVQTQDRGIYRQAHSGIRIFDLRVFAHGSGSKAHLRAYHGDTFAQSMKTTRRMKYTGQRTNVTVSSLPLGDWGQSLGRMLAQARKFVEDFGTEFLIMKFDKCKNWALIAEYCVNILGDRIYTDGGDLNRKTLGDLRGMVIVVFSSAGLRSIGNQYDAGDGIMGFKNLYGGKGADGSYDSRFDGLQYYGKGGTTVDLIKMKKTYKGKKNDNISNQSRIMDRLDKCANHSSDVLGMIYWTSTGILENIQSRNDYMWNKFDEFSDLWEHVVDQSIQERLNANRIKSVSYANGPQLRAFMPNIVMIDFASRERGKDIRKLNDVATQKLVQAYRESIEDTDETV